MNVFTTDELERIQSAQEDGMMDRCDLLVEVETGTDPHGLPIMGWIAGATSVCGLNTHASREMLNAEMHVFDARLRLPMGTEIGHVDRVRVTYRFGVMLVNPLIFELLGEPMQGPSGLLVNLRNV